MAKNDKIIKAGLVVGLIWLLMPKAAASTGGNNSGGGGTSNDGIPQGGTVPGAPMGDINESFLGTNNPRGVRNNNPGNIKIGNSAWQGKIPVANNTDGVFEQFVSFPYGTRAMIKLLQNYIAQGRDTPTKIIQFWDIGNPTYTAYLIAQTGFSANQVLTGDKPTLKKLSQAIARFENGVDILTDSRFETAYALL